GAGTDPTTGLLALAGVIVVATIGDLIDVVGNGRRAGGELANRDHNRMARERHFTPPAMTYDGPSDDLSRTPTRSAARSIKQTSLPFTPPCRASRDLPPPQFSCALT